MKTLEDIKDSQQRIEDGLKPLETLNAKMDRIEAAQQDLTLLGQNSGLQLAHVQAKLDRNYEVLSSITTICGELAKATNAVLALRDDLIKGMRAPEVDPPLCYGCRKLIHACKCPVFLAKPPIWTAEWVEAKPESRPKAAKRGKSR